MVKLFSLKSPDEWATTKQACRDTYVVTCFLPSTIRIYMYIFFKLSKYIWTLQDSKKPFQIKWKKKCKPYSNISKKCNLCLYEKFIIIVKKSFVT